MQDQGRRKLAQGISTEFVKKVPREAHKTVRGEHFK